THEKELIMYRTIAPLLVALASLACLFIPTPIGADTACIARAQFQKSLPPANRKTADIFGVMGSNLKIGAQAADVHSYGVDAAGKQGKTRDASSTRSCTGSQCTAVLMDGANWERVMVQMKCNDGMWSNWTEVDKSMN